MTDNHKKMYKQAILLRKDMDDCALWYGVWQIEERYEKNGIFELFLSFEIKISKRLDFGELFPDSKDLNQA